MPQSAAFVSLHGSPASGTKPDTLAHLAVGLTGTDREYRDALTGLASWLRPFIAKQLPHFPDEVEDLVQVTLLALHLKRGTYDPAQPLDVWVQAIARHKVVDCLRRNHAALETVDDPPEPPGRATDDPHLRGTDARHDIVKLLGGLPEKQRRAIWHLKVEGLSVAETAEEIGMSKAAVKVSVHRGLKAIAAKWKVRR